MTLFDWGSASGEGGELVALGNALTPVSVFIVTMNCSFNVSFHQPTCPKKGSTINRQRHMLKFSS